jgi:class 3 adenylate cyclase
MKCTKCLHNNNEDAKFCSQCGRDLYNVIEAFSDKYEKSKSYTPKFLLDNILKSKSKIIGERKLVTVLFADVANYSFLCEKLDPKDAHLIMDGCFKVFKDRI